MWHLFLKRTTRFFKEERGTRGKTSGEEREGRPCQKKSESWIEPGTINRRRKQEVRSGFKGKDE
jgi:hypothetical protein